MNSGSGPAPDADPRPAVLRWLHRIEDGLIAILVTAMIVIAALQIVLRNVWQIGLGWGDPLLRVLVLWVGLLGAMAATRHDKHITVDIVSRWLPERGRLISRILTDSFSALVCAVLAYHGGRLVLMEYEAGTIAFAAVPVWVCASILPLGFAVIALRFLASVGWKIKGLAGSRQWS